MFLPHSFRFGKPLAWQIIDKTGKQAHERTLFLPRSFRLRTPLAWQIIYEIGKQAHETTKLSWDELSERESVRVSDSGKWVVWILGNE